MANFGDHPILQKLYEDLAKRSERAFEDAVRREGLVDTGELLDSIRAGTVEVGGKTISTSVLFSQLLRLKDVKTMQYFTIPPLAPLLQWVERVGLSKFAYVPGYPKGLTQATETEQIYRIAAGIQYNLKARPNVKRGYRGIYNEELKYRILPAFYEDLKAATSVYSLQSLEEALGFDVTVPTPSEGINAGRIQAAWNARDTKLSRKNQ